MRVNFLTFNFNAQGKIEEGTEQVCRINSRLIIDV